MWTSSPSPPSSIPLLTMERVRRRDVHSLIVTAGEGESPPTSLRPWIGSTNRYRVDVARWRSDGTIPEGAAPWTSSSSVSHKVLPLEGRSGVVVHGRDVGRGHGLHRVHTSARRRTTHTDFGAMSRLKYVAHTPRRVRHLVERDVPSPT